MPVVLALGAVLGVIYLAFNPKSKVTNATVVTPPTPPNSNSGGVGITTGFTPPPIQASVSAPVAPTKQTNAPGTSASGVPNYSANAQEFNTAPEYAAPGLNVRAPFYNPGQLAPIYSFTHKPATLPAGLSKGCGGCGASCSSGCMGASDCAIASERNNEQGCMVPTTRSLLRGTSPKILQNWADNISSAGGNVWHASQQLRFDQQQQNPQGEDTTIPAAATNTGIGLNYRRPNPQAATY